MPILPMVSGDDRTTGAPLARAAALFVASFGFGLGVSELGVRLLRDPALHVSVWWPLTGFGLNHPSLFLPSPFSFLLPLLLPLSSSGCCGNAYFELVNLS